MTMLTDDVRARVTSYIQHQGTKSKEALADIVRTSQQRYLDVIGGVATTSRRRSRRRRVVDRELTRHVATTERFVTALIWHSARGQEPPPRTGGLGMTVEDDSRPFAGWVADLREANEKLLETIAGFRTRANTSIKPAHPFFGPLNCTEWAAFQRVHDEDHVQHAGKILAVVGYLTPLRPAERGATATPAAPAPAAHTAGAATRRAPRM